MIKKILIILLLIFTSCYKNKDIENVKISGFVKNEKNSPIKNARVNIQNAFYENSPDESYNKYENYKVITNSLGYYSINLNKSAYVQILVSKEFYKPDFKTKNIFSRNLEINFNLKANKKEAN